MLSSPMHLRQRMYVSSSAGVKSPFIFGTLQRRQTVSGRVIGEPTYPVL
jgi:hypothetical protein